SCVVAAPHDGELPVHICTPAGLGRLRLFSAVSSAPRGSSPGKAATSPAVRAMPDHHQTGLNHDVRPGSCFLEAG
ncbi:hypothetical protein, partial [Nitrolancea hollandica]|uniref:hypothetical protein n=1 Tax=Nitrolancea hollandica TaxID=1206749 RepID=UPI001EE65BBE